MMVSFKLDGNRNQRCAFCKYWYDPINQHIKPQDAKYNLWKFDAAAKCQCLKCNLTKGAGMKCDKFESKIT